MAARTRRARRRGSGPGQPSVEIVSPRNGARQTSHAVVVKVEVDNFQLAPRHFGGEPQLGEGHIRFGLNRVPDCVDPVKLQRAINSPFGNGRLVGASFDFPELLRPQRGAGRTDRLAGSYSPATRPEIYYHGLPPASTAWSSTSPRTTAPPPPSTPSPTSRSCPAPATARSARRQSAERQGRRRLSAEP